MPSALRTLAAPIKARWSCEQTHQQLEEELGLDHFEGRTWSGLHHHALMTMISFAFLQHLRLREIALAGGRGKMGLDRGGPPQPSLPALRRALLTRSPAVRLRCPTCNCNGRLVDQPPG